MEGVAGVVGKEQLTPQGFEFQQFREFMTAEVNAAIEGAREEGATDIVVSDSHGTGLNLLMDELPQDIQLVRSWPRPLGMMEGIDDSFQAAFFLGYHSGVANPEGVAAHTISSAALSSVKINGNEISEGGISALIAGHFGVPVVMMSGDDAAVKEVSDMLGPIEGAVVKWQSGHTSARTLMPEAARSLIKESARRGLQRRQEMQPFRIEGPLTLDLTYQSDKAAELIAYLPNIERINNHSVRFIGSIIEVSMFIEMALGYSATLR
jgi:D-amino peptidase